MNTKKAKRTVQSLAGEMETQSKFKTANGELSTYALACGYIERIETPEHSVTLWHEGGPCYHVRHCGPDYQGMHLARNWETYTTRHAAYRQFKAYKHWLT